MHESEFDIIRASYGSHPWRAVHRETGDIWSSVVPQRFDHPGLGVMPLTGVRFFRTKRECVASLRADLAFRARLTAGLCPVCGTKRGGGPQLHTCTPIAEGAP
jgi:hypothetical protein